MTKLFEEPAESVEQQLEASAWNRIIFCGLASLVAIAPALGSAITAFRISSFLAALVNAEIATRTTVVNILHNLNTPLVVALGFAAFLSFMIALVVAVDPQRRLASVGMPFSIGVPLVALVPTLLLWSVETTMLDLLDNRLVGGSVDEVAARISLMLLSAMGWGLLAVGITCVCAVISLILTVHRRRDPLSLRRAFIWAVTGMLMLVFGGGFFILV